MRITTISTLMAALLATIGASQKDILYYKFDAIGAKKAINYASGSGMAPAEGLFPGTTSKWAPGKFGGSLMGASNALPDDNHVDTGWNGAFTGSFTVAWFQKQRVAPGSLLSYLFSGIGSFRCFTNGVAGTGLWVRAWGPSATTHPDIQLTTDVQTLSASKWLHIALVVDGAKNTATWYLDGTAQAPITLPAVGGASVSAGPGFRIGKHGPTGSYTYAYDIDEFRFSNRAATAIEVKVWSLSSHGAQSAYGKGCGATLSAGNGNPSLGNAKYALNLKATPPAAYSMGIGNNRISMGGIPLPFDLGGINAALKGCMWESSSMFFLPGALTRSGTASVPIAIPQNPYLLGLTLYNQTVLLGGGGKLSTSNPHASSVGN